MYGRQQGVEQREPDWWLAVFTLITRIEDGLTTQAITTVLARRNAKGTTMRCARRLADGGALVGSGRVQITQDDVLRGLRREATLTGEGSLHAARVSAWG